MKNYLKKLIVPLLSVFLIFTVGQVQDVAAQLSGGGGSAANLEKTVSGELRGKVGGGVFARLRSTSGTSTKRKTTRKKSPSTTKTSKTTKSKTTTAKNRKAPAKKGNQNDIYDEDYDDYDYSEILTYKPVGNLNTAEKLANEFSSNASEKQLILELFKVVKVAYDDEAAKKGKNNDVALAMTFFIATCVTVYNEAPEPDDQAFDNLYDALADALVEDEQFATTSDRTKQEISESLIYISGLILGGYMNGKENYDQNTITIFRTLAGVSLMSLTQIDPAKMSFNKNGLYIKP